MWALIKECYGRSARFAIALPLLFALPIAGELAQHLAEYWIGMYASVAAAVALEGDPTRMGFGVVKVLILIVYPYWVYRWLAFEGGGGRRILGDARSASLFAWVVALGLALAALQLFGGALLRPLGVSNGAILGAGLALTLLTIALDIYLTAWKVGAALGNPGLTIPASFRIMHGNFWWSTGFYLAMVLPLMIVHYAFATAALLGPPALLWPLLIVDGLVVGYLGTVLAAAGFLFARRAAERAGAALT